MEELIIYNNLIVGRVSGDTCVIAKEKEDSFLGRKGFGLPKAVISYLSSLRVVFVKVVYDNGETIYNIPLVLFIMSSLKYSDNSDKFLNNEYKFVLLNTLESAREVEK